MTDLIVYLKAPVPGGVKTRLQSRYSADEAAALYTAFIQDTFQTASGVQADRYYAAYTGDPGLVQSVTPPGWQLVPQIEADLGARMRQSLNASIASGADRVTLIGSDIPSLPANHITSAASRLETSDVVIGPTTDGGFYLIGTRRELPDIFANIAWSTDRVFEETTAAIQANGLLLGLVPPCGDVDTPEDLDNALQHAQTGLTHTRAVVADLKR